MSQVSTAHHPYCRVPGWNMARFSMNTQAPGPGTPSPRTHESWATASWSGEKPPVQGTRNPELNRFRPICGAGPSLARHTRSWGRPRTAQPSAASATCPRTRPSGALHTFGAALSFGAASSGTSCRMYLLRSLSPHHCDECSHDSIFPFLNPWL